MNRRVIKSLLINTLVVLFAFILFILVDHNLSRANQNTISASQERERISMIPMKIDDFFHIQKRITNNYQAVSPFNWNTNFYSDDDVLNPETNLQKIVLENGVKLDAAFYSTKKAYYRFEIVEINFLGNIKPSFAEVRIYKDDTVVPAFFGPTNLILKKDSAGFKASWFSGWKPFLGKYRAVLFVNGLPVMTNDFNIISREPLKFNRKFALINLEWNQMIDKRIVNNPENKKTVFPEALESWMDYGDIDGFLTLTGETTGWGNITSNNPWEYYPQKNLEILGTRLHEKGKMVGAYIMCFYTPENGYIKAGYANAKGALYDSSTESWSIRQSRFVSFKDNKRFNDIVALAKKLESLPYVDMIGFDFVRFGELVGYENADEFASDMNVALPKNWNNFSENDKIVWMAGQMANNSILQRWRAWMAHKTADYIYQVRKAAHLTKPIWVFTLGWNHGTEHGQDPYFFQDAGAFSDLVMLYEATPEMNESMKISWKNYIKMDRVNYLPGNQFDAELLRSLYGNNPVEEYQSRLDTGANYADYRSTGVFIHDISRAFWGRRGNYSSFEWLGAGFSSVSALRFQNSEIPFCLKILSNKTTIKGGEAEVLVRIDIPSEKIPELKGKELTLERIGHNYTENIDISEKTNIILTVKMNPKDGATQYLGLRGKINGYPAFFTFGYIKLIYGNNLASIHKKADVQSKGE